MLWSSVYSRKKMKTYERIQSNPDIMFGKPVIKGTRVTVELILRKLSAGLPAEEIVQEHPTIKRQDVLSCLEYAAYLTKEEITHNE